MVELREKGIQIMVENASCGPQNVAFAKYCPHQCRVQSAFARLGDLLVHEDGGGVVVFSNK